jgi:hypothetical protein
LLGIAGFVAACEGVVDQVKESPTAQLVGLVLDQPCVLTPREGRRLAGAYLRRPEITPLGFDPIFITGRESRAGLPRSLSFDDTDLRRLRPEDEGNLGGSKRSEARLRLDFAPEGALPNVYDMSYRAAKIEFTGPLVVGPGMAGFEVPTSGLQSFEGRIEVSLTVPTPDGSTRTTSAVGRFSVEVGYGSRRAQFAADGFGGALPFERLTWSNLYLCGTRLVSSGEGRVLVGAAAPGAKLEPPFAGPRDGAPLNSVLESALFAPAERPAPPYATGGVFVVQSDVGTLTAVFLSDLPQPPAPPTDTEAES